MKIDVEGCTVLNGHRWWSSMYACAVTQSDVFIAKNTSTKCVLYHHLQCSFYSFVAVDDNVLSLNEH